MSFKVERLTASTNRDLKRIWNTSATLLCSTPYGNLYEVRSMTGLEFRGNFLKNQSRGGLYLMKRVAEVRPHASENWKCD